MFCNDLGDRGGKMGVKTVISIFIDPNIYLSFYLPILQSICSRHCLVTPIEWIFSKV
jgi:hypothetical protein